MSSADLSALQLDIVRVLWKRGEASAGEVQGALEKSRGLALTTVSTLLTRLEKRGIVAHRSEGRLFVYHALVSESDVRGSMLGSLMKSVFRSDPTELVSQLLNQRDLSPGDLERIRELIAEAALKNRGKRRAR
ncbi:MAG: BlaI/MecI/CopY family transcriptional regulator [Gemmatimonadota bacterium]